MATHKGSSGLLKIGGSNVGELLTWNLERRANVVETTAIGDTDRSLDGGTGSASGSASAHYDPDDAIQNQFVPGSKVTLVCYPEGDTTGDETLTFSAVITRRNIANAGNDETVKIEFDFEVDGAITAGTAA